MGGRSLGTSFLANAALGEGDVLRDGLVQVMADLPSSRIEITPSISGIGYHKCMCYIHRNEHIATRPK